MKVVFVSIDKPAYWGNWHSGKTDTVYYSNFLKNKEMAEEFVEKVKQDYPNSNLAENSRSSGKEYFIEYVVLDYNKKDVEGFENLKNMMRAYYNYEERHMKNS